jgi:hypothetical protein
MKMTGFFDNKNFGLSILLTLFLEGTYLMIDAFCKLGLLESLFNVFEGHFVFGIVAFLLIIFSLWLVVNIVCQIFDVYGRISRRRPFNVTSDSAKATSDEQGDTKGG